MHCNEIFTSVTKYKLFCIYTHHRDRMRDKRRKLEHEKFRHTADQDPCTVAHRFPKLQLSKPAAVTQGWTWGSGPHSPFT